MKINEIEFNIKIIVKNNKNMYMRVKGNDIVITCSKAMNERKIYEFINTKKEWIYKQYIKQAKLTEDDGKVYFLGKEYDIKYHPSNTGISLSDALYIGYSDKTVIPKEYDKFCESLLKMAIYSLNAKWSKVFNRQPTITYKKMKSKWGVCYHSKNKIVLNINLVHYDLLAIESVLVHEYVHFFVPNHSKEFYDVLLKYMPDYRLRQKLLK